MRSVGQLYEESSATVIAGTAFPETPIDPPQSTTSVIVRFTPSGNDMTLRLVETDGVTGVETDGVTGHESVLAYQPSSAPVPNGRMAEWEFSMKNVATRKLQFKTDAAGQVNMLVQYVVES